MGGSGVKIAPITNTQDVALMFQRFNHLSESLFTLEIERSLDLDHIVRLPQKAQQVGNCTVASFNSLEHAVLYLVLKPKLGHSIAELLAKRMKQCRVATTRNLALKTYLDKHSDPKTEKAAPDFALIGKIYSKKTRIQWVDKDRQERINAWTKKRNLTAEQKRAVYGFWGSLF